MRRCLCRLHSKPLLITRNCGRLIELGCTPREHPRLGRQHAFSTHGSRKLPPTATQAGSPPGTIRPEIPLPHPPPSPLKVSKSIPSKDQQSNVDAWILCLDKYLPKNLRLVDQGGQTPVFQNEQTAKDVLVLLAIGRNKTNVDLLVHMALAQGRHDAVLHLVDVLLTSATSAFAPDPDELPSNIKWPVSFVEKWSEPINLDHGYHSNPRRLSPWPTPFHDSVDARGREKPMQAILPILAELTLAASSPSQMANDTTMRTVHRIIARMHSLDLVPSEVYDYSLPCGPTTTQRPPIMHLLSSRILTSISDAVWCSQQDEAIAQALDSGKSRFEVGRSVPGGPVRPRVSKLGPEPWIEFLLWCCVDGGYTSAGVRIINLLHQSPGDPWFPINWCSDEPMDGTAPKVNWAKAKHRFGGPVGRLEGYSSDKPLAEIPPRTISTEVVMAMVESFFSNSNVGIKGSGLSATKTQQGILDVVKFLEPHYLGPGYFDYLTVRFLQSEGIAIADQPEVLREWTSAISQMRSLKTVRPRPTPRMNFELDTVMTHSELHVGILQQVLQGHINRNNTVQAVEVFAQIQQHVDSSKLESMGRFLTVDQIAPTTTWLERQSSNARRDYVASHGQLPPYRIAGFLNLVTDAGLFGLGDWLIESPDVDGPLIPVQEYPHLSLIVALIKYADKAQDAQLIRAVISSRQGWKLKPPVNVLRSLVNAMVSISDWRGAESILQSLKGVPGGGYSPRIVTRIAAKLRYAEAQIEQGRKVESHKEEVEQSFRMLVDILGGKYDGGLADFTLQVRREFHRQIGFLLRVFHNTRSEMLQEVARVFKSKYPTSNQARLAPGLFNDLLAMIVETNGAAEGRRMFLLFCKNPRQYLFQEAGESQVIGDYVIPEHSSVDDDGNDDSQSLPTQFAMDLGTEDRVQAIPFEEEDPGSLATNPISSRANQGFNPIVIPNLQTLHIIVRRALVEKAKLRGAMKDREGELYHILRWAEHYYKAFNVSRRDIEAETQLPASLRDKDVSLTNLRSLYSRDRKKLDIAERGRLKISGQFLSDTAKTRLPGFGDQSIRVIPQAHPWGGTNELSLGKEEEPR